MPPYSGNDSVIAPTSGRHNAAYYADVAPSTKQGGSANDDNSASEASQSPSRMNMLLDFNPCTSMTSAASSMTSAVFKTRTCKYCGQGCNKLRGYNKELVEDENGDMVKVHVHKWCSQLMEWKDAHSEGWKKVMAGLLGHFRAVELAKQRAIQEAARKAEEARRKAEEARRKAEEDRKARVAALEEQRQREAEEEAARVAAAEAQAKREKTFSYKVGKKLSGMKLGCKGKKNKAVDVDATEKNMEAY